VVSALVSKVKKQNKNNKNNNNESLGIKSDEIFKFHEFLT